MCGWSSAGVNDLVGAQLTRRGFSLPHSPSLILFMPLRPLLDWFFRFPLLFAGTAAVLLILWGVGWDPLNSATIGLPGLFWHESLGVAFVAGLAVCLLLGEICYVGYLLQADDAWLRARRQGGAEPPPRRTTLWYFLATGSYPLLAALAILPAVFAWDERWAFAAGGVAGAAISVLLAWAARFLQPERTVFFDWLVNFPRLKQELPADVRARIFSRRRVVLRMTSQERRDVAPYFHLHALQVVATGVLIAVYLGLWLVVVYANPQIVSPALVLCVLAALLAGLYGFLVFHFPRAHFGVAALLVLALIAYRTYVPKPYRFEGLDYDHPVELARFDQPTITGDAQQALRREQRREQAALRAPADDSPLLDNQAALDSWRASPLVSERPILVVVAVSGGGIRAAAWSTLVLARLERELPDFPYHVRLITGASGGMVGTAYYVATLRPPAEKGHALTTQPEADPLVQLVEDVSQDALSPLARHLLFPLPGDRGTALEQAWEANTGGVLANSLYSLRQGESEGWRPSLVFSPMLVEDGRRLIVSNLDLGPLTSSAPSALAENQREDPAAAYSVSGLQFFELFPQARQFKLSTAARMSSAFPYITPAAELPTNPPRRVVDAGYYDNFGVNLAGRWLYQQRRWIRGRPGDAPALAGVALIQIRDQLEDRRSLAPANEAPSRWRRSLGQLTAPLEGVLRARNSTMSFRNDELVALLDQVFNDPDQGEPLQAEDAAAPAADRGEFFRTFIFEFPQIAPLTWRLTPQERSAMQAAADQADGAFKQGVREFKSWWEARE